jgi:hypothetical protein
VFRFDPFGSDEFTGGLIANLRPDPVAGLAWVEGEIQQYSARLRWLGASI